MNTIRLMRFKKAMRIIEDPDLAAPTSLKVLYCEPIDQVAADAELRMNQLEHDVINDGLWQASRPWGLKGMADRLTEEGMDDLALHNSGLCGECGPCQYCEEGME